MHEEKKRIGQDLLLMGADIIATPLTRLINNLIKSGVFPEEWKKAVVMPILKKGDQKDKKLQASKLPGSSI